MVYIKKGWKPAPTEDFVCPICNSCFTLLRYRANQRKKRNKNGLIFCSNTCSGTYITSKLSKEELTQRALKSNAVYTGEMKKQNNIKRKLERIDEFSPFRLFLNGSRKKGYRQYEDLTLQYLKDIWDKQEGKCALTGVPMEIRATTLEVKKRPRTPLWGASLDRIDSSKEYVQGNVQFVCKGANLMKNNHTNDEALEFVKLILEANNVK